VHVEQDLIRPERPRCGQLKQFDGIAEPAYSRGSHVRFPDVADRW
jgi:hypothetical protein